MVQLILSWFSSIGQWMLSSPWFGPGAQWFMKHVMEGTLKQTTSSIRHARHLIPRVPLKVEIALFTVIISSVFIWSMINPHDYFTWFLEVLPVIVEAIILIAIFKKFPFTRLAYWLIFSHSILLMVGGHYTYALVPLGEWMKEWFGFARNNYDRLGHFFQGFVPAILAREILLRTSPLKKGKWLFFICVCICLSISAVYELVEWAVAMMTGDAADSFLGMQGDEWDTQWDMFCALVGATTSLILLSEVHNRQIGKLKAKINREEKKHVA